MTKEELLAVPIPARTRTYTPVPHSILFNEIYEALDKENLAVISETYRTDPKGNKLIAKLHLNQGDGEKGMMLAFRNSYDATMSVGYGAGAEVKVCSNGQIAGEYALRHKHQGDVLIELRKVITESIKGMGEVFSRLCILAEELKQRELQLRQAAMITGLLLVEKSFITATQAGIIAKELQHPSHKEFEDPTMWSYYNHVTEALKTSAPQRLIKDHININTFMSNLLLLP